MASTDLYWPEIQRAQNMQQQAYRDSALANQAAGLGVFGGGLAGAIGQLGQQQMNQSYRSNPFADLADPVSKPKPRTIREELQLETDEWLKDIN